MHQFDFYYCCMKQRIYLDTSVIGGAFDEEFKKITNQLFEMAFQKKITLVISDVTEKELANAPLEVVSFFAALNKDDIEFVFNNEECINLANLYIKEGWLDKLVLMIVNILQLLQFTKWTYLLVGILNIL